MTESAHQSRVLKLDRERNPSAVVFKINDSMTSGIPDVVRTANGKTSCWEFKVERGGRWKGTWTTGGHPTLQHTNMRRLAAQGIAFYVIFGESPRTTAIVRPCDMAPDYTFRATELMVGGWDYEAVVGFMEGQHG